MSKHTPGPWEWLPSKDADAYWALDGPNGPVLIGGERHDGKADVLVPRPADARLIAASPLMAAELEEFIAFLDAGPDRQPPVFLRDLWRWRERLRAVHAKAEGK